MMKKTKKKKTIFGVLHSEMASHLMCVQARIITPLTKGLVETE